MLKNLYRFINPKIKTLHLEYFTDFKPRYGHGKPPHDLLYKIINDNRKLYVEFLDEILSHKSQLQSILKSTEEKDSNKPAWNNGFLPGLDIMAIYTMLARGKTKKYVEVGSGNSTKVAYKAKQDLSLKTNIVSIDPMPRAEIDHLADTVIRKAFEDTDFEFLFELEENHI